jgi:anti-sigma factor RsiW
MHEEWTDKLSDFLDGELTPDDARAVEAHLRGCAECAAVLEDLKRVVARAREAAAVSRPPQADLWAGIAARIDDGRSAKAVAERSSSDRAAVTPFTDRSAQAFAIRTRRIAFTLPELAAAAAIVAAVSGGVVWQIVDRAARNAPTSVDARRAPDPAAATDTARADDASSATERIVPVVMADAQYDAAVSDLEGALKQGRGRLDAATIAIVEHNLQIIDQAIDQAREALAADPANTYLSGHLVEARRRKLDLLRRAAALTSESD